MSISVAMATYNGEKYIREQLTSIINQLGEDDEVIISDDKSSDNTTSIINEFIEKDKRIKLIKGPCLGVIKNFENAISNCKNDYVFLSDQDDIWHDNKIESVLSCFEKTKADLILHNADIMQNGEISNQTFFEKRGVKKGIKNNILKNSYIGCCMAFKADMKKYILPFPENLPMHDQWIGIICEKYGKVEFIDTPLITYRRHDNNASGDTHSSVLTMLKWRFNLISAFNKRSKKIKRDI